MKLNDFNKTNEEKNEAFLLQRTKEFGIVECASPVIIGDGVIFDPATGSFGGINF